MPEQTKIKIHTVREFGYKIVPTPKQRRENVEQLEKKVIIDWTRRFDGLAKDQSTLLLKVIDRNASLRKQINMEPGICEKIKSNLLERSTSKLTESTSQHSIRKVSEGGINAENIQSRGTSSDELFHAEYPIQDYVLIGSIADKDLDTKLVDKSGMLNSIKRLIVGSRPDEEKKHSLKHTYGKFIDNNIIQSSSKNDLEQEAISAMKMVSADLQTWIVDVLDNGIVLDPVVLAQVTEMDEKAGDIRSKTIQVQDADITGFNVLLNACKPAIFEARPPIKLNVVRDSHRPIDAAVSEGVDYLQKSRPEPRKNYGAWYLPPKQWIARNNQDKEKASEKRYVFGGIVQEKLDEIARKRALDMEFINVLNKK